MANFRGMDFTEAYDDGDGPITSFAPDAARVVRKYFVNWESHYSPVPGNPPDGAVQNMVGFPKLITQVFNGKTRRYISRITPMPDPWYQSLYCASVSPLEPQKLIGTQIGPNPQNAVETGDYETAKLSAEFRSYLYDIVSDGDIIDGVGQAHPELAPFAYLDGVFPNEGNFFLGIGPSRYVTRIKNPNTTIRTLRRGVLRKCVDKKPIPEGLPWREFRFALQYTWHDVPDGGVPYNFISIAGQTLNGHPFDGFPVGTVMFDSARVTPTLSPVGQRLWQVQYLFIVAPNIKRNPPNPVFNDIGYDGLPMQAGNPTGWNSIPDYAVALPGILQSSLDYWRVSFDGTNPGLLILSEGGRGSNINNMMFRLTDFGYLFMPDQP